MASSSTTSTAKRTVQWSATNQSRFLVAGSNELRLQEHVSTKHKHRKHGFKTVAVCSDLPGFKSLAWSPDPQCTDLCAIGLNTGRTILLRIQETPVYTSSASSKILHLNVRQSRPCNAVAFSHTEPNLLVAGYSKVRDNSLLIWDVRDAFMSHHSDTTAHNSAEPMSRRSSYQGDSTSPVNTIRPRLSSSQSHEQKPIAQFCLSEDVAAATFTYASKIVLASVASKHVRAYDLRAPAASASTPVVTMNARATTSLVADPFDTHRFLSVADDGIVRIWDLRHHNDPILAFSSEDGIARYVKERAGLGRMGSKLSLVPSTSSSSSLSGAVTSAQFSTSRRGHVATLDSEDNCLSAWNIFDSLDDDATSGQRARPVRHTVNDDNPSRPTLYYEQRTGTLPRPLTSFAFVPGSGGPQIFVTMNKDGNVEFCETNESPQAAFATSGMLAFSWENRFSIQGQNLASQSTMHPHRSSSDSGQHTHTIDGRVTSLRIENAASRQASPERRESRGRRHKYSRSKNGDHDSHSGSQYGNSEDEYEEAIPTLQRDISIIMRQRAIKAYAMDASRSRRLVKDDVAEMWTWIHHADTSSSDGRAFIHNFDFAFKGVLQILRGFAAEETHKSGSNTGRVAMQPAPGRRNRGTMQQQANPANLAEDVKAAFKQHDVMRRQDVAYAQAASALNKKNASTPFTVGSSSKTVQRQLALSSIGPDFASADVSAVIKRYEKQGQPAKAAAWAVFSGNIELAIRSLKNNEDEKLKLLAPILASYVAQREQGTSNTVFTEMCQTLSTSLEDGFMRAIFAYLASGDWSDVLDEHDLPLKDKVGIALRFLSDDEMHRKLAEMVNRAIRDGDLQGLMVSGLGEEGFAILQSYVDRTGDVQTAALAAAFVHPVHCNDSRAERWITTYRKLLDHWQLYTARVRFDIARSNRARASLAVRGREANRDNLGSLHVAPHMLIRCHFCNETVRPREPSKAAKAVRTSDSDSNDRVSRCPNCHKSFPRCAICLGSIEVSRSGEEAVPLWCWCQHCRHGGHASHILEWFRRGNKQCPVADCDCACREPATTEGDVGE